MIEIASGSFSRNRSTSDAYEMQGWYSLVLQLLRSIDHLPLMSEVVETEISSSAYSDPKQHGCSLFYRIGMERGEYWRESLRSSQDHGFEWSAALTKLNIADSLAKEGKYSRAKRVLGVSKRFFVSVNDLEGLSWYHFNMALVYAEEGIKDLAMNHYRNYKEFPHRYREKVEEETGVVIARFKEKGWDLLKNLKEGR
jgi:hypothetical protein